MTKKLVMTATSFLLFCAVQKAYAQRLYGYVDENQKVRLASYPVDSRYSLFTGSRQALVSEKTPTKNDAPKKQSTKEVVEAVFATEVVEGGYYRSVINTPVYLPHKNPKLVMAKYDIASSLFDFRIASVVPDARAEDYYDDLVSSGTYKSLKKYIEKTGKKYGVDPALIKAVIAAESGYNPTALSNAGAIGLMQIIPPTGERYGVVATEQASTEDRLLDPHINIDAGARYLRDLLKMFNNQLELAIASYNAGEGAVKRYGGIPPYPETQKYVPKVLRYYQLFNPGAVASVKVSKAEIEPVKLEEVVGNKIQKGNSARVKIRIH